MGSSLVALSILLLALAVPASMYPVGPWNQSHATYYGPDNGLDSTMGSACDYNVAIAAFYGAQTTALSSALFQRGERCGACFEVQCMEIPEGPVGWCMPGKSATVTATNLCPSERPGGWCADPQVEHFDLSVPAFTAIAKKQGQIVPVQYRRVPCSRDGGVRFLINGHPYAQSILIFNVGGAGDVASTMIRGDGTAWLPLVRNWGENWAFDLDLIGQILSFSVTNSDGATVLSTSITDRNWRYGTTYEGSQFN